MLAAEHVKSRFPAKIQNHDYYTNFFNSGTQSCSEINTLKINSQY